MFRSRGVVILVLAVLLLAIVVWRLEGSSRQSFPEAGVVSERSFSVLTIDNQSFEVIVSQTPSEITQGLSDRADIGAVGMLFVLPEKRQVTFWMYHMRFPLDFIWIADGKVVDLHQNVPAVSPSTPDAEVPVVTPQMAVEMVLEVPEGFIQKNGITKGMKVVLAESREIRAWK